MGDKIKNTEFPEKDKDQERKEEMEAILANRRLADSKDNKFTTPIGTNYTNYIPNILPSKDEKPLDPKNMTPEQVENELSTMRFGDVGPAFSPNFQANTERANAIAKRYSKLHPEKSPTQEETDRIKKLKEKMPNLSKFSDNELKSLSGFFDGGKKIAAASEASVALDKTPSSSEYSHDAIKTIKQENFIKTYI